MFLLPTDAGGGDELPGKRGPRAAVLAWPVVEAVLDCEPAFVPAAATSCGMINGGAATPAPIVVQPLSVRTGAMPGDRVGSSVGLLVEGPVAQLSSNAAAAASHGGGATLLRDRLDELGAALAVAKGFVICCNCALVVLRESGADSTGAPVGIA